MERPETPYAQIVAGLRDIGFRGSLLEEGYRFSDWFTPGLESREIAAAAFGQTPVAYDSALIGIALANGAREQALVNQYRALGAPIILEIDSGEIREWAVSHKQDDHRLIDRCRTDNIRQLIAARASDWRPEAFLRSKNLGTFRWSQQLELFAGLLPELEGQIQNKLDPLLRDTLSRTKEVYRTATDHDPDESKLFKLVFWLLTAKVFHDRRVKGFESLGPDPEQLIAAVAKHYKFHVPTLLIKEARQVAASRIWADLDFRNLSVEVLSHIWSTALIDKETTDRLGIHKTSRTLVRYIVEHIQFPISGDENLIVLEPCAGSAVFLIGAMNVLRQVLFGTTPDERHQYFVRRLAAIEKDPFGVEISQLALTLADFPNPNGWDITKGDVFEPGTMSDHLKHAGVVLCNPPFRDFNPKERRVYGPKSVKKPVELLNRVLDDLHPKGVLGFVLPRAFIDGNGYAGIRSRLADRFASLHVTALPDKAFEADAEVALLIATDPIPHNTSRVVSRKVDDDVIAWRRFELSHEVSFEYSKELTVPEARLAFPIAELPDVWDFLRNHPKLGDIALVGRGIEWKHRLNKASLPTLVRDMPEEGYRLGIAPQTKFNAFERPALAYLNMRPQDQRGNAWKIRDWNKPKAIIPKTATSRRHWRMAAFPDGEGLVFYQTYIGIWPTSIHYDEYLIAAILNSPVANAFVAAREGKVDITIDTLKRIPVPRLTDIQKANLRNLIREYQRVIEPPLSRSQNASDPQYLLKQIDALILDGYGMPPRLECTVLNHFRGSPRRTAHEFGEYLPDDCEVYFSLSDFISPNFLRSTVGALLERTGKQ